ncbi:MAG: hypothetical protein QNJ81_00610 [Acidimicrobiia bacterium]|nr:hypothetical protein [Acidimicrobiia bacterium]
MATGIDFAARRGGLPRWVGGILGCTYPLVLTAGAISVGFDRVGDMADLAASILAVGLFLIAAPTAWLFTVEFIEAGRLLIVTSALLTSLPLWYLVGSRLAYLAPSWVLWLRRYVVVCLVWSVLNVLLFILLGSIAG